MPEDKINRQVQFIQAQIYDPGDSTGANNTWIYDRAPEGYLFVLQKIAVSTDYLSTRNVGLIVLYDGHEYTHWNQWPGVESREILARFEFNNYSIKEVESLLGWECKEFTIGARSSSTTKTFKGFVIVWYYLKKASREELLEYAIKHPKVEDSFKHAISGITIESSEAE